MNEMCTLPPPPPSPHPKNIQVPPPKEREREEKRERRERERGEGEHEFFFTRWCKIFSKFISNTTYERASYSMIITLDSGRGKSQSLIYNIKLIVSGREFRPPPFKF